MAIEGVDYAWNGPSPAALKAAGKHFACRYGGPGSDGKQLHAAELAALRAVGIDVVANAEGTAGGFVGTSAGRSWAQQAINHFKALGMPDDRPIYFSVDFDAGSSDWPGIDDALRGAASVIGAARVGVYGSYKTVAHCRAAGTARWFWQTYAWSGGQQPPSYVHLYQYHNGATIGGGDCDLTRALLPDYGQWGYQQEDEMTKDEFLSLLKDNDVRAALCRAVLYTDGVLPAPAGASANADGTPNKEWTAWGYLANVYAASVSARDYAAAAKNVQALAAALGPVLAPMLPQPTASDPLTPEQLEAALVGAFRKMAAGTA